jgi:DNA-binding GntR family transcriptional regulator
MIESKRLTRNILEHLRSQIVTCQLPGGQKLNEILLSSQLNVSRPPLREAFQILEQEHFIVSVPRKGRYVAKISQESYERIHEVKKMMECYAIDYLKANNIRNLAAVELALVEVSKKPRPTEDPFEKLNYLEALFEFHVRLIDSVNNELLSFFYGTIRYNISRYQYWLRVLQSPNLFAPNVINDIIEEHHKILNLIKNGEYDDAKHYLMSHMDETLRLMKTNF